MATTSKEPCNDIDCAMKHSKECESCNKKMETFLKDVILKLEVKMPKEQGFRKHGPHYLAQPSTLTATKLGPGSIVYDPHFIQDGVDMTKTMYVSAVKEYEERNKMKDTLIEILAKFLLSDDHFLPDRLIDCVIDYPYADPPDFDRYILKRYLNNEQLFEFDEGEKKAKNHLGLRILRQVGPDGLLAKWDPPDSDSILAYELYVNGLFVQRIPKCGRKTALLHPVDLSEQLTITLKVSMSGVTQTDNVDVLYPEKMGNSNFSSCLNCLFGSSEEFHLPECKTYMATNPLELEIIRRVGPSSLLVQWIKADDVFGYEFYADGVFLQRIDNPERTKSILHPIDLNERIVITLNPLKCPK